MTTPSFTHIDFIDRIAAYLAGGVPEAERAQLEAHVAACPTCAEVLEAARRADAELASLFADARPASGFEDRIIQGLRSAAPRRRVMHPMVRQAAVGIAATILIGSVGYVASGVLERHSDRYAAQQNSSTTAVDMLSPPAPRSPADLANDTSTRLLGGLLGDVNLNEPSGRAEATAGRGDAPRIPTTRPAAGNGDHFYDTPWRVSKAFDGKDDIRLGVSGVSAVRDSELKSFPAGRKAGSGDSDVDKRLPQVEFRLPEHKEAGSRDKERGDDSAGKESEILYLKVADLAKTLPNGTRALDISAPSTPAGDRDGDSGTKDNAYSIRAGGVTGKDDAAQQSGGQGLHAGEVRGVKLAEQNAPSEKGGADGGIKPSSNPAAGRKIIRSGEMTFEVDSFDSTVTTITRIVDEESGFVGTTDSDKLANGKVKGTITVRVPPEHLDTLVLKLRGIGDLKSQKIGAQDITKQYTDLESGLRAARAMEDRLLEIIKTGKGEVKDLLEAEKQLGVWREKIEQLEGEIRYDNNLVSLSTLSITVFEKDIKAAAWASESEQVNMSLETQNVEEAYNKAREAIAAAKGRIVQSDLKQFEAGQFGATIGAEVPPDAADALIGRLRQIDGRVASFQRQRTQSNHGPGGAAEAAPPLDRSKVRRDDVKLALTMYNLANIAPRRTLAVSLAAANVDEAYRTVLDNVASAGGRVVTSNINRARPDQATASVRFQVPAEKADVLLTALRAVGEVMRTETTENPDTQNVTEAKRGFVLQIASLASANPRQVERLQLAAQSVPDAFNDILAAVRARQGRVMTSQLDQQDRENVTGTLEFEVSRDAETAIESSLKKAGDVVSRNVIRSQDTDNTVDSKVRLAVSLVSAQTLPPRQRTTLGIEVPDVARATSDLLAAARGAGGRAIGPTESSRERDGRAVSRVIVDVPLDQAGAIIDQVMKFGEVRVSQTSTDEHVPEGHLARAQVEVTLANSAATLGGEESTWDAIRHGFSISGKGLRWCLEMLVVGLCFVAPVALVAWLLWRAARRNKTSPPVTAAPPA